MNNFSLEVSPKLNQEFLGLVILGPTVLKSTDPEYYHVNFLLDGLLSQKGSDLNHKDTFLTKQFGHTVFVLYLDQDKMSEISKCVDNSISIMTSELKIRKKILITWLSGKEIPGVEKLQETFLTQGLELVI
ncbi:MAG: hypothetical protein ACOYL6_01950 [Bacteriovoracaceae bacterium]